MNDRNWATVAGSASVSAVAPSQDPGGNDGQVAVMSAWCGATVDTKRQELVIPAQGGHSDYYGNEVYVLGLNSSSPAWQRVTNPRYSFGTSTTMDDGSPRSNHGNSQLCYAPNVDKTFIAPLIYTAPLGDSSSQVFAFDRGSGTWSQKSTCPSSFGSESGTEGGAVYDTQTGSIWIIGAQADTAVDKYDPVADKHTMSSGAPLWSGYNGTLAISSSRRLLVYINGSVVGNNGSFKWLDLNNIGAGWRAATVTGNPPTGDGPGLVWHDASGGFLAWNGSPSTGTIKKLTPASTPASGTWTWTDVTPGSGNTTTPSSPQGNGTYGRFNLISNLGGSGRDVLVLVNAVNQPAYVYKLPAGGI